MDEVGIARGLKVLVIGTLISTTSLYVRGEISTETSPKFRWKI